MKCEGMLLVVKDADVSKRFYQEVLSGKVLLDLGDYVQFEGFCIISEKQWRLFQDNPDLEYKYGNNVCQIAFEEEDLDAFMQHFAKFPDIRIMCSLKEYEWGQRSLRFYDPDGHVIEVGEDMKVVVKRYLSSGMSREETVQKTMYPRPFIDMCWAEI